MSSRSQSQEPISGRPTFDVGWLGRLLVGRIGDLRGGVNGAVMYPLPPG